MLSSESKKQNVTDGEMDCVLQSLQLLGTSAPTGMIFLAINYFLNIYDLPSRESILMDTLLDLLVCFIFFYTVLYCHVQDNGLSLNTSCVTARNICF